MTGVRTTSCTAGTLQGRALNQTCEDLQLLSDDQRIHLLRKVGDRYRPVASQADWPTYNGQIGGNRYSALDQIDKSNVTRLRPRWMYSLADASRLEVTPVVVDGGRTVFEERLAVEAARFHRSHEPYAVLLLDIDDFKAVNDGYGHPAGDAVLRAVAGSVRANSRKTDTVARYGGEELILLLPGTDSAAALLVGEKLRAAVAALAVDVGRKLLRVTVSVGAAIVEDGLDPTLLVANADAALYRAKRAGKNRVELHTAGGTKGLRQPSAG